MSLLQTVMKNRLISNIKLQSSNKLKLNFNLQCVRKSTTNASLPKHEVNKMEGSYHWYFEKGISLTLLPIFGISAFYGSLPVNDYAMGVILPIHIHMGLTSVIVDYLPFRRTPVAHCIALIAQHTATFYSMYGSYIINSRDVGLTEYFKRVWKA